MSAAKLCILDAGGVGADRLIHALVDPSDQKQLLVGSRAQGALLEFAEFAALESCFLTADYDTIIGDFPLPALEQKLGPAFAAGDTIVPVRDPMQRALMLYVEAAVEPLHSLHAAATKETFEHFLHTELRPNAQCQRIAGAASFEAATKVLSAKALYVDSAAIYRFCVEYAQHRGRSLHSSNLNEETTNFHDILCMLDAKTIAKFMRQNRDDLLLSIWVRRTWEARLLSYFATPQGVAA